MQLSCSCVGVAFARFQFAASGRPERRLMFVLVEKKQQPPIGIRYDQSRAPSDFHCFLAANWHVVA